MKIRCCIIDDEKTAIKSLEAVVNKHPTLVLEASFTSPLEALTYLKENPVELVFLDINMDTITGLEFVKLVDCKVIFTTAHKRHVHEALSHYNTVDYLEKPISFARLTTAVKKVEDIFTGAFKLKQEEGEGYPLITEIGVKVIPYISIVRIKSGGYFSTVYYVNESGEVRSAKINERLNHIQDKFPGKMFSRVHRSHIVNKRHVIKKMYDKVLLDTGEELPLGLAYKKNLI